MYRTEQVNCFEWLRARPANSLQAVCTDPPYGVIEFSAKEITKLRAGKGGVWRIAPKIGGSQRDPLPRFTVLTDEQKKNLRDYFCDGGKLLFPALVPGAHVCVAGHPILQHLVQATMVDAGFEVRSAIMRLYFGFRGGDRPKNAEEEFPEVCVSPKGAYEPWMLFRNRFQNKPLPRIFGNGALADYAACRLNVRCRMPSPAVARRSAKKQFPITRVLSRSISCASSFAHF